MATVKRDLKNLENMKLIKKFAKNIEQILNY